MTPLTGRPPGVLLRERSVLALFSDSTARFPDRVAVRDGHRQLTFRELDILTSAIGARLRSMGLGASTTPDRYDIGTPDRAGVSPWVLVHTGRSVDVVVGLLSVLRAGGAYVCVPSGAPKVYIRQICETALATAILTDDPEGISLDGPPCLCFRDPALAVDADPYLVQESAGFVPHPRDLACAIFTSGSTGRPKGAVLEHQALSAMLAWQQSYMDLPSGSHTAAFAPFGFIASPWELLFPLASGMTLHILGEEQRKDPLALETSFEKHRIRYVFLSPEMAELFSHHCKGDSLRYVRVAGGPLRSCPPTPYEILYSLGMSENGGSVTFLPIQQAWEKNIPLGGAFGPTRIYLVDDENRIVQPGRKGKMAISSPSLARGYLGMPERTAECFIANPFEGEQVTGNPFIGNQVSGEPGDYDRLYLSGDLARQDENGMLVHCGRNDFVVKIRGQQVDPGHVEAVLAGCGGVRECVVSARKSTSPGNPEYALWAWAGGSGIDANDLRGQLAAKLPEYMVPERIRVMDALPRGVHGKIQRTGLPDIPLERAALAQTSGAGIISEGHGPRLKRLCDIFAEILLMPEVGPLDSFFALGGDSIKLVRLQLMLRGEFSVNLSYGQLFRRPWPAAILEMMDRDVSAAGVSSIPTAPPQSQYPLTMPMRQMYLLWRLGRDSRVYEVDTCVLVEGDVDGQRLENAFADLVAQEPLLRSRFAEQDGEPAWVIDDTVAYDFGHYRAPDPEAAKLLWEELSLGRPPIDLSQPPLFFVVCIEIDATHSFLGLTTHHILVDAASSRLLVDAWWDLYTVGEIKDPGFGQTATMTDYVLWDRARQNNRELVRSETWWQALLETPVPPLDLAGATTPRPKTLTGGSAIAHATLEKGDWPGLFELSEAKSATVFQVLLAVWAGFLSRQARASEGFDEFVMGVPFVGRDHPDLQFCMGMFVRTLPLRFCPEPDGSQSFSDWLAQVRDLFLGAWEHQACPLERIVQLVNPPRIPGRSPLFDVMVNRLPRPRPFPALEENGCRTTARVIPGFSRPTAMFDLILEIREGKDRIFLEMKYAKELFPSDLVQAWVDAVAHIARVAVSESHTLLKDLPWPSRPVPDDSRLTSSDTPSEISSPVPPQRGTDRQPDTPGAQALAAVWKEVLETDSAREGDDFFEQGGDSITAMRLEAELFKTGWYLPATRIYETARLGELANVVEPVDNFDDEDDEFD